MLPSTLKRLLLLPLRTMDRTRVSTPFALSRLPQPPTSGFATGGGGGGGKCWKCGKTLLCSKTTYLSTLLCPSCGSPQKVDDGSVGFFDLLSHPQTFSVDLQKLTAAAKRLQKALHPDLFASKAEDEQVLSQELSSLINKALSTLSNPIHRGHYLLHLHGVRDSLGQLEKEVTTHPGFLEEVLELNERLEQLGNEGDWRRFREDNDERLIQLEGELEKAFAAKDLDQAKLILARMQYFETLQRKLKELKFKLGIVE